MNTGPPIIVFESDEELDVPPKGGVTMDVWDIIPPAHNNGVFKTVIAPLGQREEMCLGWVWEFHGLRTLSK